MEMLTVSGSEITETTVLPEGLGCKSRVYPAASVGVGAKVRLITVDADGVRIIFASYGCKDVSEGTSLRVYGPAFRVPFEYGVVPTLDPLRKTAADGVVVMSSPDGFLLRLGRVQPPKARPAVMIRRSFFIP